MRVFENGVYRDMTAEEIEAYNAAQAEETESASDPLTQMIEEMSQATTLAAMRAAAKNFLKNTEAGS
ncbi:MAG: hypothetical protein PUA50_00295 [Eubacteriales bacterium]|nr:hypothetical protein [Eubacteriales bacterium]